jgi:membrane fusion protein (multidrug efflux system)
MRSLRATGACGLLLLIMGHAGRAQAVATAESAGATDKDGHIRVELVPYQQSVLSSELSAKIVVLPFREGDTFRAGDTLVGFDCDYFHAELNKAAASAEASRQTLKADQRLAELHSMGELDVNLAAAKVKEAEAEVAAMQVTVGKCKLLAPFAGRVAKLEVHAFEYVAPGKPLLEILATRRLEVQMNVPAKWLAWLKTGGRFTVRVDELDHEYAGRVVRLGARIDPLTQSVSLAGEVEGTHPELLAGMSGSALFVTGK